MIFPNRTERSMKAALIEITTGTRAQRAEKSKNQSLHPIEVSISLIQCSYLAKLFVKYIGLLQFVYFYYTNNFLQ